MAVPALNDWAVSRNHEDEIATWLAAVSLSHGLLMTVASSVRVEHWGTYVPTPAVHEEHSVVEGVVEVVTDGEAAEIEVVGTIVGEGEKGGDEHPTSNIQHPTSNVQCRSGELERERE